MSTWIAGLYALRSSAISDSFAECLLLIVEVLLNRRAHLFKRTALHPLAVLHVEVADVRVGHRSQTRFDDLGLHASASGVTLARLGRLLDQHVGDDGVERRLAAVSLESA